MDEPEFVEEYEDWDKHQKDANYIISKFNEM